METNLPDKNRLSLKAASWRAAPRWGQRLVAPKTVWQLLRFLLVGVSNTLVDVGIYYLLTRLTGLASFPALAKGISYTLGVVNSYLWNSRWTFSVSRSHAPGRFIKFAMANLLSLGVNAALLQICWGTLGWDESLALGFATAGAFAINFLLSKLWVFKP